MFLIYFDSNLFLRSNFLRLLCEREIHIKINSLRKNEDYIVNEKKFNENQHKTLKINKLLLILCETEFK